ncbi:aldo/keto reductase [Populibacterium corticicola]|uniref:Aldo/keto reductase n=1 Tax=Populibacterium corticicola TaxID=1812826 RepID=A0ABW5XG65_9MICO
MTTPTFVAHDGFTAPQIGFGTYKMNGVHGARNIVEAAKIGYRLFDSAFNYENEGAVGHAAKLIQEEGIARREDIIIASKLPGRRHEYDSALVTIEESLFRAGLDHYDLYLIHWPNPIVDKYVEAWSALIEAQKRGYVKHIGVSNFLPEHLERLERETGVMPVVNQIELHPHFPQLDQIAFHKEHGIITQAWSPLARMEYLLNYDVLQKLSLKHRKTLAQIVLRWETQIGAMPIPRSGSAERQAENFDIFDFELSAEEVAAISALGRPDGRMKGQNPAEYEEF